MKKRSFALLTLIATLICSLLTCSCSERDATFDEIRGNYADLAKDALFSQKSGEGDCEITVTLPSSATFNRLVLRENLDSVSSFTLSLPSASSPFYGNDFIGGYRYCCFPAVTTDSFTVSLKAEGKWYLGEIEAYYIPAYLSPFSLTSYITAKAAFSLSEKSAPTDVFDIVYSAYVDKDGNVRLPDYYVGDERIAGEKMLAACVDNIRSAYPQARVTATVLGDREFDKDGLTLQQRCSSAFSRRETLSASLIALVDDYGLDGISFDYEYPVSENDYSLFCGFCSYFRKILPSDKLLTVAVSAWCVDEKRFSKERLSCFDRIVLMSYDQPDVHGCHSSFYTAYSQLRRVREKGVPFGKILLGLPLYSKPADGSPQFVSYAEHAEDLSFFSNLTQADFDGELKPCYFNGRQLVCDKTALARDAGLLGIAAWHFSLDSEDPALSLLATAYRTAFPRSVSD